MFVQNGSELPPGYEPPLPADVLSPYGVGSDVSLVSLIFNLCFATLWLPHTAFVIWMILHCLKHEPDRYLWFWVILVIQPIGAYIYFLVRWVPSSNLKTPTFFHRFTRGRELRRLETAALQIGNAHQFIQWGDALREVGHAQQAAKAYATALQKDPENTQALWGAALVDLQQRQFDAAAALLQRLLAIDPAYKFGDVSLAYGRTLYERGQYDEARRHLEQHVRRWRHPEALYLLATALVELGDKDEARGHLQALLLDIDGSPRGIARRHLRWKSKAKRLLRQL